MKKNYKYLTALFSLFLICLLQGGCAGNAENKETELRIANWEEYMDEGGWDEEERIVLDNGVTIFGEKPLYEDFEDWYFETYGMRVRVEYSSFGTNEDLYNQLNLGDTYDLVCPSEYMIMKLMAEDRLEPYSEAFYDKNNEILQTRCRGGDWQCGDRKSVV